MRLQVNTSCTSRSACFPWNWKSSISDMIVQVRGWLYIEVVVLWRWFAEYLSLRKPLLSPSTAAGCQMRLLVVEFQTASSPNLVLSLSTVKKNKEETGVFHFTWCLCRAGRRAVMLNAPSFKEPEGGAAELNWTAASSVRAGMEYYLFLGWMWRQESLLISLWLI